MFGELTLKNIGLHFNGWSRYFGDDNYQIYLAKTGRFIMKNRIFFILKGGWVIKVVVYWKKKLKTRVLKSRCVKCTRFNRIIERNTIRNFMRLQKKFLKKVSHQCWGILKKYLNKGSKYRLHVQDLIEPYWEKYHL